MKKPLLSVCLITFNQSKYIREAIDSILAQKTDFEWELVVADDYSTDGTREILLDYQKAHPDRVKLILQKKNVGAERNWLDLINYPQSRYIAYMEGDDYWSEPSKLQQQVNFLEKNPDYTLCFHSTRIFFENGKERDIVWPKLDGRLNITTGKLLKENFIPSNSVVYRRQDYSHFPLGVMPGDWFFHLYHAQFGKIKFIDKVMSAYRRHEAGIWWETTQADRDEIWKKHGIGHLVLYGELLKMFGETVEYRQIIDNHVEGTVNVLSRIDDSAKTDLLNEFTERYPGLSVWLFLSLSRTTYRNYRAAEKESENNKRIMQEVREENDALRQDREAILNSKAYRVGNKIAQASRVVRRKQ